MIREGFSSPQSQANDAVAREFDATVQSLVSSGRDFEAEVRRFRYSAGD